MNHLPALAAALVLALPASAAQTVRLPRSGGASRPSTARLRAGGGTDNAAPPTRTYTAEELVRAMRISELAGMCSAFRAIRQGLVRISSTGIEVVGSEQQLNAISDACFTDTVEAEGRQP